MSNEKDDIGVRIVVDYQKALKDVQQFTDTFGKGFAGLPKIVQQVGASIDNLNSRIDKLGNNHGAQTVYQDFGKLPPVVEKLTASVDRLSDGVDRMAKRSARGLRETNDEATKLERTLGKIATGAKIAGAGVVGWQAGKMVMAPHIDRMLDYDTRLAQMANVAYAGKPVAERIAGKGEIDKVILGATRAGGGTREEALETLQRLVGSGALSEEDSRTMLPSIMRASSASGASPDQIADIGIRSMQNFGFKASDLPHVIDMAIKSGNLGGFELKDMAKWLPAQMAEAASIGMKGEKGFAQLLALNQASITTAGSTDVAGNNVSNLLSKINSSDTQLDFKKQGINLTGSLQAAAGQGIDPITAFARLIDTVMSKDKNYVALEAKRKSSTSTEEQASIIEKQLLLAEGTAIGKVLQDRQARTAFLGFKKQGAVYNNQVNDVLANSGGTTDDNFSVISSTPAFARQQSMNDALNAQNEVMQKLVPTLTSYWEWTSKIAKDYPGLSASMEGGKIAIGTLAAGTGAASIVMTLLTKNAAAASVALGAVGAAGSLPGAGDLPGGKGKFGKLPVIAGGAALALMLSGDSRADADKGADPAKFVLGKDDDLDAEMAAKGMKRKKGFLFDSYIKDDGADGDSGKVSRALQESIKFNPIEAKIALSVAFDSMGNPVVSSVKTTGSNVRMDTGPMMTH